MPDDEEDEDEELDMDELDPDMMEVRSCDLGGFLFFSFFYFRLIP